MVISQSKPLILLKITKDLIKKINIYILFFWLLYEFEDLTIRDISTLYYSISK